MIETSHKDQNITTLHQYFDIVGFSDGFELFSSSSMLFPQQSNVKPIEILDGEKVI